VRYAAPAYDATGLTLLVTERLLGDATLDGTVDFNDLVSLARNYDTAPAGVDDPWMAGDFTGDGLVDFSDLVLLAQHYNPTVPGTLPAGPVGFSADAAAAFASVPEPGTAVVAAVGTAAILRRRRRGP
jgi:hypothetical protein